MENSNTIVSMRPALERVVLEVFGGCNYRCQMCPQSTGRGNDFTKTMPLELFENILDQILELGKPIINLEGSGEPTMVPDLHEYIQACTNRGLQSFMFTNGFLMQGNRMNLAIDAGLSFVRFSVIGYDREQYKSWMSVDKFNTILNNIKSTQAYIQDTESSCQLSSYHLILNPDNEDYEINQYRNNIIEPNEIIGYVWKQHNWSGNYNLSVDQIRKGEKKTCGRPFANELTVRAGGLDGHFGAVTPCCQTMGPPNEALSVLGHLDEQSLLDVWNGKLYNELRQAHSENRFDDIEYCKGCDFLIDDPEVLVWTNDPEFKVKNILGTQIDLNDS